MKNYKLFYFSIPMFLFFFACSEKSYDMEIETGKPVASIEDYFEFFNSPTDGSIIIQGFGTNASGEQSFMITSSYIGDRSPFDIKVNDKIVSFDSYYYSKKSNKSSSVVNGTDMHDIYGSDFKVVLEHNIAVLKNTTTGSDSTVSVYIPEIINVQFSGLQNGRISAGSIITWNIDGDNENGVVLAFEYSPSSQYDEDISTQYPDGIMGGISIVDNGMHVITSADLQYLPDNALINVYVGRAGYAITTGSGGYGSFSIAGYTLSLNDFIIQK